MATQVLPPPMPAAPVPLHYPEADGRPLAETEAHAQCLIDSRESLRAYFRDDPNVHVGGNLLFYYSEGDPRQSVAPDVFVVHGVPRDKQLRVYKLWEEGRTPEFVLEITSPSTRYEDLGAKRGLYQVLGVHEYFLFDPLHEYLRPPLQGFRLAGDEYRPIAPAAEGALASETLGLELRIVDRQLRFHDPRTRELLRTPAEEVEARQEAERARQAAEERAAAAEAELARLRAELAGRQP
jgi:Uma2 family endonuclease